MTDDPIFPSLDRDRSEIRLLKVLPPGADGKPSFQFRIVSLDDNPTFACVSYVWGDPSETDIVLDGQAARISVGQVLPAIKTAIHHYQEIRGSDPESLWLWADALCINQSDKSEKSYQIPLMARIFSGAEHVICCLPTSLASLSARQFRDASDSLNEIERRLRMAELVGKDNNLIALPPSDARIINWAESFDGLTAALESLGQIFISDVTYWKRIWILQEVSLASSAIIARDQERFDWWKMKLVYRWRTEAIRLPKPDFVSKKSWESLISNHAAIFWDLVGVFAGSGLSETTKSTRRGAASFDMHCNPQRAHLASWTAQPMQHAMYIESTQGQIQSGNPTNMISYDQQRPPKLQIWLTSFQSGSSLQATNSKDHIYGLLAIAPIAIKVDYSQSLRHVYSSYIATYLRDWNNHFREELPQLHFLRYCGRGAADFDLDHLDGDYLPSWVPNYPFFSKRPRGFVFSVMLAPFGYPSSSHKGLFPPETEEARVLNDDGISRLRVSGINLEAFSLTSLSVCRGDEILDIVSGVKLLNRDAPAINVLVETVMWDKLQQESNPDARDLLMAGWVDSCASALREDIARRYPNAAEAEREIAALDLDACKSDNGPSVRSFRDELFFNSGVQSAKRLIFTESGRLCLASSFRVQEGDLLCILDGGSMPSILRRQGPYYIHICQAFVLGLENGQAIEYLRRGDTKIQKFELI
ncbi:heterokaryon incompatibility protein-domain-containing protein [Pestalotiopsis sp. NC0098]|nr:heterokaryon incompatibility protein-domain-containing protein [Pestalotiopsis sp. NC0098]